MLQFAVRLVGKESKHSAQAVTAIAVMIAMITSLFMLVSGFAGEMFALTELAGSSSYLTILEEEGGKPVSFLESELPVTILDEIDHDNVEELLAQRVELLKFCPLLNTSGSSNDTTEFLETFIWGMNLTQMLGFRSDIVIAVGQAVSSNTTIVAGQSLGFSLNITEIPFPIGINEPENTTLWITGIVQGAYSFDLDFLMSEESFIELFSDDTSRITLVEAKLRDPSEAEETARAIEDALERKGYHVKVISQKQSQLLMEKTLEDLIEKFRYLELFLLLIVLIRIYHITSWFILEHSRELKILRSLGQTRNSLIRTVLQISFVIGNLGIVVGVILGIILPFTLVSGLSLALNISNLYPQISLVHLIEIIIVTNLMIFVGAIVPAWQSSRRSIAIQ